jgi:integrase
LLLTAAFTGLRLGELVALRWRDVDLDRRVLRVRASWSGYELTFPKAGRVRSVPLAPQVADALRPGAPDELVFPGRDGDYLDRSALRRRYRTAQRAAGLRPLRFHDLRHTFATTMVGCTSIRRVQEWMGHSDLHSTMRYLHYTPRDDDAELVARAFAQVTVPTVAPRTG